jgi:apolipoprotein N-acyltransferase
LENRPIRTRVAFEPPSTRARFRALLAAWAMLVLASPGILTRDGAWLLAPLGVGLWGAAVARPLGERRWRALLAEALVAGVGYTALMWWVVYVVPVALVYFVLGFAVYFACAGALARALRSVLPLGLAVALGWMAVEVVRDFLPPPFGLGWLRLGHALHAVGWIAPAARVVGVEGLGFLVACTGGLLAELFTRRVSRVSVVVTGLALFAGLVLARFSREVATTPGPRVLLVQPALEQRVKQHDSAESVYERVYGLTVDAVRSTAAQGETFDLVCWGETMLPLYVLDPDVLAAFERGARPPAWFGPLSAEDLRQWDELERAVVAGQILRGLPPGTSFLSGVEVLAEIGGELRRRNAIVLWNPDGSRAGVASKRFLVPGAETMLGLERYGLVRRVAEALASYVPDFIPAERTDVLELATRDGRRFRIGASVCFDNAFLEPYLEPLVTPASGGDGGHARGLDFHLVTSNEAWYRESCEMDQMVAFSRLIAISTGRAMVRATNSGVSLVLGPDGAEIARLTRDGRDRSVPGSLLVTVPIPADPRVPLYPRTRDVWRGLLVLGALVPLGLRAHSSRRSSRRSRGALG